MAIFHQLSQNRGILLNDEQVFCMTRLGTFSESTTIQKHRDERLCSLKSVTDAKEFGKYAEVVAVCSCGRMKEYYANEIDGYFLICNGVVIMKYRKKPTSVSR
jgi:hypothetical protein